MAPLAMGRVRRARTSRIAVALLDSVCLLASIDSEPRSQSIHEGLSNPDACRKCGQQITFNLGEATRSLNARSPNHKTKGERQ